MKANFNLNRTTRLTAPTITLLASCFSAIASAAPVSVYQHVNYKGNVLDVEEGEVSYRQLRDSAVGNDRISSIKIEDGYEVLACKHGGFRGTCKTFTNDTSDLRTINFNDLISSLRVTKLPALPVTVYKHVNFRGNALSFDVGDVSISDLRNSTVGNDTISSIQIADGYEVEACQHGGFRGRCEIFTSDTTDLRDILFNDVISSLTVRLASTINSPPVAPNINVTMNAGESIDISVDGIAYDTDNDALTFSTVTTEQQLADLGVTDTGAGTYSFAATSSALLNLLVGETQTVSFEYAATDGMASTTGTIDILVEGILTGSTTYGIGEIGPGGGTVFQLTNPDANGRSASGLEYAPEILTEEGNGKAWGCFGVNTGVDDTFSFNLTSAQTGSVSSGILEKANEDGLCISPAAELAFAYSPQYTETDGWYLPSITELLTIRAYLDDAQRGGLATSVWSSSEQTGELAWALQPIDAPTNADKNSLFSVLPIRSF